jgi:hypothetical protein
LPISADPIDPFYPRSKTLSEQIRRLDKKRPSISPKSRLEAPCVGVETVVTDIVGIADIQCRPGVRRPSHDKLRADVFI